jgi:hypothetical protein
MGWWWWLATMSFAWKGVILALPGVPPSPPIKGEDHTPPTQSGVTTPVWLRDRMGSTLAHCANAAPHLPGESKSPALSGKLSAPEGAFCQSEVCFWIALHKAHSPRAPPQTHVRQRPVSTRGRQHTRDACNQPAHRSKASAASASSA